MTDPATSARIPREIAHLGRWVSTSEFAAAIGRTRQRVIQLCASGDIIDFRVITYKSDSTSGRGRWWICYPFSEK